MSLFQICKHPFIKGDPKNQQKMNSFPDVGKGAIKGKQNMICLSFSWITLSFII